MRKNVNFSSIGIILLLLSFASTFAQRTTAEIVGTVTDETGGVLPGVEVVITNLDTALTRSTFTNDSGNYHVRLLPVGRYSVSGELVGFKKQEISGIILQVDQVARIDLSLEVGEITELVEVEGTAPLTKTDDADIGMVIENQQIEELPLRGENSFVDLVSLDAGAAKVSGHLTSIFTDLFGGMTNAYGSPPDGSRFMIDGVDVKDTAYSRIDIRLSGNATREMKSQMNSHSAEFGMNSGIQVNMVTKSGTNEIHGNVFWDHRNSSANARNFFDPSRESRVREGLSEVPILQFNIFGASVGGPIVQDQTFFFFNYQGTRENKSLTRPASVPTMKMRNGDFSEILPGTVIKDPLTGQPFPGNIIPENRIHPVARNMMFGVGEVNPLWPVPDRPGIANNILPSRVQEQVFDQYVFRVDHSLTDSDNICVRYIYDKQDRVLRYNKFLHQLPDYNDIFSTPAHNARVGWTKVMGATAVNELKLGVNRMTQTLEDEIYGTPVPKLLGIEGTSTLFQYNPWVNVAGFSRTGTLLNAPNNRVDNTYLAGDTISWNVGSHALGFGGEWREREQNGGSQPIPNGYFMGLIYLSALGIQFWHHAFPNEIRSGTQGKNPSPENVQGGIVVPVHSKSAGPAPEGFAPPWIVAGAAPVAVLRCKCGIHFYELPTGPFCLVLELIPQKPPGLRQYFSIQPLLLRALRYHPLDVQLLHSDQTVLTNDPAGETMAGITVSDRFPVTEPR